MNIPFDALMTDHGMFRVPLASIDELSETELAAIRAGITQDHERFEAQR